MLFKILLMTVLFVFTSLPLTYAKGENVTIKETSVNARSGPGTEYEIVDKLQQNEKYPIIKRENDWIEIQLPQNKTAWVANWVVTIEEKEVKRTPPYAVITASSMDVYSKPGFQGKKIATVSKNDSFKVLQEKENWYQIIVKKEVKGWVPKWFTQSELKQPKSESNEMRVTVLYDDVPLRKSTSPHSEIVKRASKDDTLKVLSVKENTYEVKLSWGKTAYVAGWLVKASHDTPAIKAPYSQYDLSTKTIVLDPGHGGNDGGTIGANKTLEKNLTLHTAQLLQRVLTKAGANVILTREQDSYLSLSDRVLSANKIQPDAFISIHYDSAEQSTLRGVTPYFYHSYQKPLAKAIQNSLENKSNVTIREERFGDYHVLRTNGMPAILLELGYLSNADEEEIVTSYAYQEAIVTAVYKGLGRYFEGGSN